MNVAFIFCDLKTIVKFFFSLGVGYSMLIISFLVSVYYNTIIAWVLYYLFESFRADVPWRDCNNAWNSPNCFEGPPKERLVDPINVTVANATTLSCPKYFKRVINGSIIANLTEESNFMCKYVAPKVKILPAEDFLKYSVCFFSLNCVVQKLLYHISFVILLSCSILI